MRTGASQNAVPNQHNRDLVVASLLAFLSGMAPDLDILIRSQEDPMLFLEFHRQFTHSLIFIPVGGFICALVGYWLLAKRVGMSFGLTYLVCTVGFSTHGLLDACTSYGTLLLWPFSNARIAWHNISIIDPLYTLPLIAAAVYVVRKQSKAVAIAAFAWMLLYPVAGVVQRERVEQLALAAAEQRGHEVQRLEIRPSFANLLVWKAIYQTTVNGQKLYVVDGFYAGTENRHYPGESVAALDIQRDLPWLDANSQQAKDIERFRWFSNDYLSLSTRHPNRVVDMRYSLLPNEVAPLWGIQLSADAASDAHVDYVVSREVNNGVLRIFWQMLAARPLSQE